MSSEFDSSDRTQAEVGRLATHVGWHPEDIKAALRKRFGSLSFLAHQWGVSRQAVSQVITGPLGSIPIERRIADLLGTSPHRIWPERWSEEGAPLSRKIRIMLRQNKTIPVVDRRDLSRVGRSVGHKRKSA